MTIGLQAYLQGYMHEKAAAPLKDQTAVPLKDQTVSTPEDGPGLKSYYGNNPDVAYWRTDAVRGKKMPGFKRQPDPRPETLDIADLARTKGELKPTVPLPDMKGQRLFSPRTGGYVADEDVRTDPWGWGIKGRIPGDTAFENATVHKGMSLADILKSIGGTVTPGTIRNNRLVDSR
jgi:hypothetical protein